MNIDLAPLAAAAMAERPGQASLLVVPEGTDLPDRLAALLGADRLFVHSATAPSGPNETIAVCLGAKDQDIVGSSVGAWPGGDLPVRHRLRRIDTEYAGCDLGLLVIAQPADAVAVLRGATATLSAGTAIVMIDTRGAPAASAETMIAEASALLAAHRLMQLPGPIACFIPAQAPFDPARVARPQPDGPREIPCDDRLPATGLHATEPGEPTGGRWTGAAMQTRLWLPRPPPGRWRLAITIADWGNTPDGFDIGIDGRRLSPATRDATGFGFPPVAIAAAGLVLPVDLYPKLGDRDPIRWPRRIGIRLRAIRLSPA